MDVIVALDHRFARTPDGAVWTQTMFAYSFWGRYLAVFDRVYAVARALDVPTPPPTWVRADGERVALIPIPHYIGPRQYLRRAAAVGRAARDAVDPAAAVILRLESQVANCVEPELRRTGHPYGVEVTGDPYDGLAPGSVRHPLRPFLRWWFPRQVRRQCANACAASYVTAHALQRRYPPAPGAFSTHYSSIELPAGAFVAGPRPARRRDDPATIVTVGTLEQLYKAPDVLIDAVALAVRAGLDLRLVVVGDGKHRGELEARAAQRGLGERVSFLGQLTAGTAVRERLDRADLFVLASHQEGLPRAMIEAMARGLPCIGSTIGGIPELLPREDLVPPGDAPALADKIREVLGDPERLHRMSGRNLAKSEEYRDEVLGERRTAFYQAVQDRTRAWLGGRGG